MTSRDFCYWLQGYIEIAKAGDDMSASFNDKQVEIIEKHLHMVFVHEIDPSMPNKELDAIHNSKK